jgi:hypothetical protein
MKSVGEVMAIGRTFKEALMKAVRSLETGKKASAADIEPRRLTQRLVTPHPERLAYIRYAFEKGMSVREVARMTSMDPWFLNQMKQITDEIKAIADAGFEFVTADDLRDGEADGRLRRAAASEWKLETARRVSRCASCELASSRSSSWWTRARQSSRATRPISIAATTKRTKRRPPRAGRSSSWAAGRTASGRASSSTTAAATRPSRCVRTATRPSWSTAIRRPSRPTTTPATASTSSR